MSHGSAAEAWSLASLLILGAWGCSKAPTPSANTEASATARASEASDSTQPEGPAAPPAVANEPLDYATLDDDALASLYKKAADALDEGALSASQREHLEAVGEHADDPHLRANAWLALGSRAQDAGRLEEAIGHFRRVALILPEEPAGHAVLAMALAARERYDEAISAQEKLIEIDPDDLQAWLIWGELEVKAGHSEKAAKVYAGYEMRRKGLLDGLTLQRDGAYRLRPKDRVDCAVALAAAPDNGTAMGLLYALSSDPDASVREALVRTMGFQRFVGYLKPLEHHLTVELETSVKVATLEAIGAIRADPVETRPGVAPAGDAATPPKPREGLVAPKGAPVAD